jgi:8-amino-7-oxononanoate synthase
LVQAADAERAHLQTLIGHLRQGVSDLGYRLMPSATAIQPILVGANDAALQLSEQLRARGLLVTAIRPPTVPVNTARLRVTLSASHSLAQVDQLLNALADIT